MKPHIRIYNGRWGYVSVCSMGARCAIPADSHYNPRSLRFRADGFCKELNRREGRV